MRFFPRRQYKQLSGIGVLAFTLVVLLLIPLLILEGVIPFSWRLHLMVAVGAVFAGWSLVANVSASELGIRTDNISRALRLQLPVCLVVLALLILAPSTGLTGRLAVPSLSFFSFYVLVSSPVQEFIYRSFLHALAKRADVSRVVAALIQIVPYVWVHIIYRDLITILFAATVGTVWSLTYQKEPNLIAVSVSHAVIGAATIALGLV